MGILRTLVCKKCMLYINIFGYRIFKFYCISCYSNSKEPFHSLKQKTFDKLGAPFAAQQAPRLLCIMPAPCMAVVKIFPLGREQAPKKNCQRLGSEWSEITGNLRWLAIQVGWKPHSRTIAIGVILSQVWDAMCHIIHWFHVCFRGCTLRNSEWKGFGLDGWKNELLEKWVELTLLVLRISNPYSRIMLGLSGKQWAVLSCLSWTYLHFSYKLQGQEGTWFIIQPCSRHSLCHTRFELQLCFCWWGRCSFVPQPWRWWDVRRKVCIE